jgi:hypothetical protein
MLAIPIDRMWFARHFIFEIIQILSFIRDS